MIKSLDDLQLTAAERDALSRQGFVAAERRGGGRTYYKLRFRLGDRQRVRYLGDDESAAHIRRELEQLQAARRAEQRLKRMARAARSALRESKAELAPRLDEDGLRFHGFALRRVRKRDTTDGGLR